MYTSIPFIAALVATTAAVQCTSPPPPDTVNLSEDWDVQWTHVKYVLPTMPAVYPSRQ